MEYKVRVQVLYATSCLLLACKFAGNWLLTTVVGNKFPESCLVYGGLYSYLLLLHSTYYLPH